MKRTFYPIGQGAFFTEKHTGINVVYDCGSFSSSNRVDKKIKNAFESETKINLLFISHYDEDHVNKIHLLLETNTIAVVILPLLQEKDRILLQRFYSALRLNNIARLLEDPEGFFGGNTKIFYIEPGEDPEGIPKERYEKGDQNTIAIKDLMSWDDNDKVKKKLPNKIRITAEDFWEYIPYNHCYFERNLQFAVLLADNNIDMELLRENPAYGIKNATALRKIYKELPGTINENSLIVYSGPTGTKEYLMDDHFSGPFYWHSHSWKVACIYTGDMNLHKVDLKSVFALQWDLVGTVQVPHHGSKKDFTDNFLDRQPLICPISFGNENTYGHPSIWAVEKIRQKGSIPILVSENTETVYIQIIHEL